MKITVLILTVYKIIMWNTIKNEEGKKKKKKKKNGKGNI